MKLELSQAELNELVYALGYTQIYGKLRNIEVADELEDKLYKALVIENWKLEEKNKK
jgi:formylmethanofuran dehydrogenase subunit B